MFPDFEKKSLLESLRESDYDTKKAVNMLLGEDENVQKGILVNFLTIGAILADLYVLFVYYVYMFIPHVHGRTKYTGETSRSVHQACQ